jgi:uridine kinase
MSARSLVVGISGGTGSGKTTIADRVVASLPGDSVLLLPQDHYYKDLSHLTLAERSKGNFDHPKSLDTQLMVDHVRQLREGRAVERPMYDFTQHLRLKQTVRLEPRAALILEGILLFENEALRNLMDIKVFVDTDADLRFIRRLRRDLTERGRTLESVVDQYMTTVPRCTWSSSSLPSATPTSSSPRAVTTKSASTSSSRKSVR